MKCHSHPDVDAVGICMYCGKALCKTCVQASPQQRVVCSSGCVDKLQKQEAALELIRSKTLTSLKVVGFFSAVLGALAALLGLALLLSKESAAGVIIIVLAAVFLATGFRYLRLSKVTQPL